VLTCKIYINVQDEPATSAFNGRWRHHVPQKPS